MLSFRYYIYDVIKILENQFETYYAKILGDEAPLCELT